MDDDLNFPDELSNRTLDEILDELKTDTDVFQYVDKAKQDAEKKETKKRSIKLLHELRENREISIAWAETYDILYGKLYDEDDHKILFPEEYLNKKSKPYNRYLKDYQQKDSGLYTSNEISYFLHEMEKAYNDSDLDAMYEIYDKLHQTRKIRIMDWWAHEISCTLGIPQKDINQILKSIKNETEAKIIRNNILINSNISTFPKSHTIVRNKYRKTEKICTYERALKKSRRILEKQLQNIGTGIKRSQKLSQILTLL